MSGGGAGERERLPSGLSDPEYIWLIRLFTVPYFSVRWKMSIVECDGLPSWFLDVSRTRESTKYLWVGVVEGTTLLTPPPLPMDILYSP